MNMTTGDLAGVFNAAAKAMRSGKLIDIQEEIRRTFAHRAPMPPEVEQQLNGLAAAIFAFGESVRIADQAGHQTMGFGRQDAED